MASSISNVVLGLLGLLCYGGVKINVYALVGFDCSNNGINVTTIATDNVPGCITDRDQIQPQTSVIQLIQLSDSYPLHVYQCKVRLFRLVTHCGMHSHSSQVKGGVADYNDKLSRGDCLDMHKTRSAYIKGTKVTDLVRNATIQTTVVLAGKVEVGSSCSGEKYSDAFGSWDSVVVQASISITLSDYTANADTSSDTIVLRSGLTCKTSEAECIDTEQGYTTWVDDKVVSCDPRKHLVLYEGPSTTYTNLSPTGVETTTYMVDGPDKIFGLQVTGPYEGCMFKAYNTEHPKLIIVPSSSTHFYFKKTKLSTSSMDLMAYVNAKFVYVDKAHRQSMFDIYKMLSAQRCNLERRTLQTLLSIANINPQEFAYLYTSQSGYTALRLGEVVHLVKCIPVDVQIRPTSSCYHEMPVTYLNKSMFLTPRSRLLQMYGTEVDCDSIINPQFRLDGMWYSIGQTRHLVPNPVELSPEPINQWVPKSIESLARAGIYTYEEAERLRERVMNPYERDAVNNIVVRGVTGSTFQRQGISLTQLVDEDLIESMGTKIVRKVWGFLSVFGNVSAGFIGLYMLIRGVKFLFDTLIHCRLIYEVYGFSAALLGGVWDSLTTYLIHKGQRHHIPTRVYTQEDAEIAIPLETPGGKQSSIQHHQHNSEPLNGIQYGGCAPVHTTVGNNDQLANHSVAPRTYPTCPASVFMP
ncbi:putative envelope protein [Lampyris noctiluca chuvirus-like virus 1]|uniref:Envelope protein n=1 Tax=Lampyris noctiluca chuvirus-like virus 1 TaxID=2553070 RepID=A0A482JSL9_9VIRU|nr:putative envelope protein [Lampyris noctiluca chuvirus-like virus 1]